MRFSSLTTRQKDFARHYAIHNDIVQAALLEQYSDSYSAKKAYTLLNNPAILNEIRRFEKEYEQQRFAKLADVAIDTLKDILTDSSMNAKTRLEVTEKVFQIHEGKKNNTEYRDPISMAFSNW